jgi:hypothetical protein
MRRLAVELKSQTPAPPLIQKSLEAAARKPYWRFILNSPQNPLKIIDTLPPRE